MVVTADDKRRVVLPKNARPGEVYECTATEEGFMLTRLQKPSRAKPPVSKDRLKAGTLRGVNLDEPAFAPLGNEGLD